MENDNTNLYNQNMNPQNQTMNIGFTLGQDLKKMIKQKKEDMLKYSTTYLDGKLLTIIDKNLYYDGYEYNPYNKYISIKYNKDNVVLFKCKNFRKNESNRKGLGPFCKGEILLELQANAKCEIYLQFINLQNHSYQCTKLRNKLDEVNDDNINSWEDYKKECLNYLDKNDKIDKKAFYEQFIKIYNLKEYNFTYDKKKLVNLYKNLKHNNIRFTKYSIFLENNIINKDNELFLREYKLFYIYLKNIKNLLYVNMLYG